MRTRLAFSILAAGLLLTGCTTTFSERAQYGITYYCPGAGNVDFGDAGVRDGLRAAGYRGEVATVMWTFSFNPAIDQALRLNAKLGAVRLARSIESYVDKFPGRQVNLVGLSAGSGVAIWALEELKPQYQVDNVVLLGSSLWYRYDVGKAAERIKGKIYNYYSSNDPVLAGPMKLFGTIDGVFFDDGAGAVGLQSPRARDRIVNVPWRSEFQRYGYYGGHTDSTSPRFVQAKLSEHLLTTEPVGLPQTAAATPPAKALRGARLE